jgi:hypothetical protein
MSIATRYRPPLGGRQQAGAEVVVRPVSRFDDAVKQLHERIRHRYDFIGDRTPDELNYRILAHPVIRAAALEAVKGADLMGLIAFAGICRDGERIGLILDWLFDPTDAEVGRALLRRAGATLQAAGAHRIEAWFQPPAMRELLTQDGFRRWPGAIRGTANAALSARLGDPARSIVVTPADSNLHEEFLLVGFAEAREYGFLELGLR